MVRREGASSFQVLQGTPESGIMHLFVYWAPVRHPRYPLVDRVIAWEDEDIGSFRALTCPRQYTRSKGYRRVFIGD